MNLWTNNTGAHIGFDSNLHPIFSITNKDTTRMASQYILKMRLGKIDWIYLE